MAERPGAGRILVVGAGLAGAVAARTLAERGFRVTVVDRRDHLGGNAHDAVDANGVRVHAYGPHIFHTRIARAAAWIARFGRFVPYTHVVRARLGDGRTVPLPINIATLNAVFGAGLASPEEAEALLAGLRHAGLKPTNAAEYLHATIGTVLTEIFFRPYTRKMWALALEEVPVSVVRRIPLRLSFDETYYDLSERQMLPENGYAAVFAAIFSHENIRVELATAFAVPMLTGVDHCFNAMPIDEYYGFAFGELPYRSILFHHRSVATPRAHVPAVTNFTDEGPLTRETAWHAFPGHHVRDTGRVTLTAEEPCDYRDNRYERYYPARTSDGRHDATYRRYRGLADRDAGVMTFIGRCGTYRYLDMDQVINQTLATVEGWLARRGAPQPSLGSEAR